MPLFSIQPSTGNHKDAATYMDHCLRDKVRPALQSCLQEKPRDPVHFMAQTLRRLYEEEASRNQLPGSSGVLSEKTQASPLNCSQWSVPHSFLLDNGTKYKLRPLTDDFRRAAGKPPSAKSSAPPSVFPSVEYREAMSSYEVAASLRELHLMNPAVPLVLLVECPAPTSGVFFYEGVPYACESVHERSGELIVPPSITVLQEVLGKEKIGDFNTTITKIATEAVEGVQLTLLSSIQSDYLAIFDALERAIDTAVRATDVCKANSASDSSCPILPSVLFVSYKSDTSHLTYSRLLATYGPRYEAAQRASLDAFRSTQLERKRKYTFAYALDYWATVQRERDTSTGLSRVKSSAVRSASFMSTKTRSNENGSPPVFSESMTSSNVAEKRAVAKSTKRGVLPYDAVHQTEDSMFLVVVRRLEHAAATLIQSVYRGYRARSRYTSAREGASRLSGAAGDQLAAEKTLRVSGTARPHVKNLLPPLFRACLERLYSEGNSYGSLWGDYATSPPPESRRCWIYRPVQRQQSVADVLQSGIINNNGPQLVEGWVQEELLLPPWRATQPRLHLNLLQRLKDYLTLAQCTSFHDSVQLLLDTPGMSVLQRRAYDGIKSMCLNLFHVAYSEVRQRQVADLPGSFSAYMRQYHAKVLGWFSTPHQCSLLLRAMQRRSIDADLCSPLGEIKSRRVGRRVSSADLSAAERSMIQVVQDQLAVNEVLVIVSPSLTERDFAEPPATPIVSILAPGLYISVEPLLLYTEWTQAVEGVVQKMREGATDDCAPSVVWMSTANFPICSCLGKAAAAAIPRFDTQKVEGVPPYDSFVPRAHAGTSPFSSGVPAEFPPTGNQITRAPPDVPADSAMEEWMQGHLADAADVGLKRHLLDSLGSQSGLVYFKVQKHEDGAATNIFTALSPSATLTREVVCLPQEDSPSYPSERAPSEASISQFRRDANDNEAAQVTEAVEEASVTVVRHRSRLLTNATAKSTRGSDSQRLRSASASGQLKPWLLQDDALHCFTADEIAKEVSASLTGITFKHTRASLQFSAGITTLERLDSFLNSVAESLRHEANTSLVLAMDLPSQAFYALAATIFVFRLHDTRDIGAWCHGNTTMPASRSPFGEPGRVCNDPHVAFLSDFHDVLEKALPSRPVPRGGLQCTAVQMAVHHVAQVMDCSPFPQLNLINGIRSAVQKAEEAMQAQVSPSHSVLRATQLAEQYAFLVLLDYYLWSSQSCFTPVMSSHGNRTELARMTGRCAFANFVRNVPAALKWISQIDPWPTSGTEPLHLRYSNALRRWDDKHYVCLGAL